MEQHLKKLAEPTPDSLSHKKEHYATQTYYLLQDYCNKLHYSWYCVNSLQMYVLQPLKVLQRVLK